MTISSLLSSTQVARTVIATEEQHHSSQALDPAASLVSIATINTDSPNEKTSAEGARFFNWFAGDSNSIHKLKPGPIIEIKTDIHKLEQENLELIGQYLGLSGESDLVKKVAEPFVRFNEILMLSHYGKLPYEGALDSKNYALLKQKEWQKALEIDDTQMEHLRKAASKIHINIAISKDFTQQKKSILLYFLGSETKSATDNAQLFCTAIKVVGVDVLGPVYKKIPGLVKVFQHILANPKYQLDLISGHSLGAGIAQCFAMAIGNPNLIMLDPQLLTDKQADLACSVTNDKAALFSKPHGIAITVNYDKKPKDGLMEIMKNFRFRHPGILQLKMPLQSTDGNGVIRKKDKSNNFTEVSEEPKAGKFGYHGVKSDMVLFNHPISRFVNQTNYGLSTNHI